MMYEYASLVEDGLSMRLMETPGRLVNETIAVEGNALRVKPLKLQPPSQVTYSYLQNDTRRLRWMMSIPWRIEVRCDAV